MHIFEVDTTTAAPEDIRSTTQAYVLASRVAFTLRVNEALMVEGTLRLYQLVAVAAVAGSPVPRVQALLEKLPGGYAQAALTLLGDQKRVEAALLRRAALDVFEAFELFLGDLLSVLFFAFPKFLTTTPENVVLPTAHYDDLYGPSSLLQARLLLARRKVAQLVQAENVVDLLKKSEARFGVSASRLAQEDRTALLELSARRNLWIHNAGVVNDIYLRLLRRYGVSTTLSSGSEAVIDQTYVNNARALTMRAAEALAQDFFDHTPQIQQYHSRL